MWLKEKASEACVAALSGISSFHEGGNDLLSMDVLALVLAKLEDVHLKWAAQTFVTFFVAK